MNSKKVSGNRGEPRTYSYAFSLPQLVGLGGGLIAALSVFFVLGIFIGRGYRPEAEVLALARVMPAPLVPGSVVQEETKVLKPEELNYMEQLTQSSTAKIFTAKVEPRSVEAKVVNSEKIFDYVYQAAAFRERGQADYLRRRVESTGLKAAVKSATENGTTWHRVVVLYRGTPLSTDTMREKLYSISLVRPIMKSKQPIR